MEEHFKITQQAFHNLVKIAFQYYLDGRCPENAIPLIDNNLIAEIYTKSKDEIDAMTGRNGIESPSCFKRSGVFAANICRLKPLSINSPRRMAAGILDYWVDVSGKIKPEAADFIHCTNFGGINRTILNEIVALIFAMGLSENIICRKCMGGRFRIIPPSSQVFRDLCVCLHHHGAPSPCFITNFIESLKRAATPAEMARVDARFFNGLAVAEGKFEC